MNINDEKDKKAVRTRIKKDKELMISQLKKSPIVQLSCEKTGISRATFYRWKKDDKRFAKAADTAIYEGSHLINDLAESQLLSAIADKNMTAIIFWLKHHHPSYETRVEIRQALDGNDQELTKRQKEVIKQALKITQNDRPKLKGADDDKEEKNN